jgi:hypothetical protein
MTAPSANKLQLLHDQWMQQWPVALEMWSRFTRLSPPTLCLTATAAKQEGLTGSFAMIRLVDQAIVVSLPEVIACGVENYAVEVLAHEIGHHVLAPATLAEHGQMLARMRRALPTLENQAPMVANLYTDLLINDRLQRGSQLRMGEVYQKLVGGPKTGAVWRLYMRIYEILWRLDRGSLAGECSDLIDGDAWLGARLIRSYARDWMDGAGRFATLLLQHLVDDKESAELLSKLADTRGAGANGDIPGLTSADAGDDSDIMHPALDPALNGMDESADGADSNANVPTPPATTANRPSLGQARQPFEYGEILRAAGLDITDHEAAVRYYREQAIPHLVPFPSRKKPRGTDPLPEGLQSWNLGDPLETVDWMESVMLSPQIIPGLTTVTRVWGVSDGAEPKPEPLDLDLYVDSSGSMADPRRIISYPALAGAIICLSALRAGATVQATLWSGKSQFLSTPGFVRDETSLLRVLTGYFGGGTAFPIHKLRDTFAKRLPQARPAHILIISDDGVNTLFDEDEKGNSGWKVSAGALAKARGGGTMVLNLYAAWEKQTTGAYADIKRARDMQGWNVHRVATWEGLVAFAKEFSRLRYGRENEKPPTPQEP